MTLNTTSLAHALRQTRRGALLLGERGDNLIMTSPPRIETNACADHPLLGALPNDAFVPEGASFPVLADDDVLSAFRDLGAWAELPRFLIAGAHRQYCLNPACLTAAVLTAGGNAPGLDTIVDSLVKRQYLLGSEYCKKSGMPLTSEGYPPGLTFYGIVGGYQGLRDLDGLNDPRWVMKLHPRLTDTWATRACSSLHALRTDPLEPGSDLFQNFVNQLASNVRRLGLDILYAVGGNGTLTVADALGEKLRANKDKPCLVVAGPKTMDNDVNFTDMTFGFRTTVDNAIGMLRDFHREAETLERVGIVELFGADSGFVALHAAYACGEADYVLIPEKMGETAGSARQELSRAVERIRQRVQKRRHALLVVAEGAALRAGFALQASSDMEPLPAFAHGIKIEQDQAFATLVKYMKEQVPLKTFFCQPKYLIRATPPNGFDVDLCKYTGKLMVDTALGGFTRCAVHLWQGNYVLVPLQTAVAKLKRVDVSGYYFITMWERYLLD